MTLFAYLNECGHIGPYIAREDPRYKEIPVFGLASFVLPADNGARFRELVLATMHRLKSSRR